MIYTLLPRLKHFFPNATSLESYFTDSCVNRSEGLVYDEITKEIRDPDFDNVMKDGELVFLDDDNLLGWKFNGKDPEVAKELDNITQHRTEN